jgi:hypothetical protein
MVFSLDHKSANSLSDLGAFSKTALIALLKPLLIAHKATINHFDLVLYSFNIPQRPHRGHPHRQRISQNSLRLGPHSLNISTARTNDYPIAHIANYSISDVDAYSRAIPSAHIKVLPVALTTVINLFDLCADYPTIFSAHARAFLNAQAADNDLCDLGSYSRTISCAHTVAIPIVYINYNRLSYFGAYALNSPSVNKHGLLILTQINQQPIRLVRLLRDHF